MARAVLVHVATAGSIVKEHTVPVGKLDETLANADAAHVLRLESVHIVKAGCFGKCGDFNVVDPHKSRCAGTTVAASRAFELQALGIPWLFDFTMPQIQPPISFMALDGF